MGINDEIDAETFKAKRAELHTQIHRLQQAAQPRGGTSTEPLTKKALEAFELSQTLADTWLSASPEQKRHLIEKWRLNFFSTAQP